MPSVAENVQQLHKDTYAANVQMVAQEKKNKFRNTVTIKPASGKAVSAADLLGSVEAVQEGRSRRNVETPIRGSRRWIIRPDYIKAGDYLDPEDKLDMAMDPTSKYVEAYTVAVERTVADRILGIEYVSKGVFKVAHGGILGFATTGQGPGGSKTSLPSGSYTAHGSAGLTLGKLKTAIEALQLRDFGIEDDDELYCAITPKQKTDLLTLAEADGQSLNAFQQLQLQSGKPTPLLGLNWIMTNRLPVKSGARLCPIWSKANIVGAEWEAVNGQMWNDSHADNVPYMRVRTMIDFVRAEDDGVQVIECTES